MYGGVGGEESHDSSLSRFSTIGLNEEMIRAYVRDQEHLDKQEELDFTKNP